MASGDCAEGEPWSVKPCLLKRMLRDLIRGSQGGQIEPLLTEVEPGMQEAARVERLRHYIRKNMLTVAPSILDRYSNEGNYPFEAAHELMQRTLGIYCRQRLANSQPGAFRIRQQLSVR
jgi:hypothetical protein